MKTILIGAFTSVLLVIGYLIGKEDGYKKSSKEWSERCLTEHFKGEYKAYKESFDLILPMEPNPDSVFGEILSSTRLPRGRKDSLVGALETRITVGKIIGKRLERIEEHIPKAKKQAN